MKIIFKILTFPVVAVLTLTIWLLSALLYCSSFVFGLAAVFIGLLGVLVLLTTSQQNGIILLIIAFLVSPVGLPMAAAWFVGQLQSFRYWIQNLC